ncbi:hypothetical protein QWY31_07445 [Cytophagales bacterium LB-30]|uniref:Uncharacterized protein n=1 Tax=Shiella aurantiaca TaxID=3058365 RepID=A0ABT8F4F1_9BACT|nr:hypothetical protein [Shiella aurantiaca]MDN4165330.1 hypothetical protein [Shiella aurantiaca]
METDTKIQLENFATFKHATITFNKELAVAVITATNTYIPMDEFKNIFLEAEKLILKEKITKLVFDKRALKIFHQPSMEWYFIEWKDKMYNFGLTKHRKLLPNDKIFRESVKIGREKIMREHPNLNIQRLDIQYFEHFEDALTK